MTIHNIDSQSNYVRVCLANKSDADYVKERFENAGYRARVEQPPGKVGTSMCDVIVSDVIGEANTEAVAFAESLRQA